MKKGEQKSKTDSYYAVAAYFRVKGQEIPPLKDRLASKKEAQQNNPNDGSMAGLLPFWVSAASSSNSSSKALVSAANTSAAFISAAAKSTESRTALMSYEPPTSTKKKQLKIKFTFDKANEKQTKSTRNGIYIGEFADDVRDSAYEAAKGVLKERQGCLSGDIKQVIKQAKAAAKAAAGITPKPAKTKSTKRKQTAAYPEAGNKRQRANSGKKMPPPMLAPPAIETSGKKKPPPMLPPPMLAQSHAAVASGKKKPSTILHAV